VKLLNVSMFVRFISQHDVIIDFHVFFTNICTNNHTS